MFEYVYPLVLGQRELFVSSGHYSDSENYSYYLKGELANKTGISQQNG
jgi:hypothetical protein